MSRYPELDLRRVRSHSMKERRSLVAAPAFYRPPAGSSSFRSFWDSLPEILGAADLKAVARAMLASREKGRPVIALCGAHVLKTGLGPGLIRLIERGILTGVATHGAGAIHDAELGLWGRTSEDVAAGLHRGRFGMVRETADFVNAAARQACERGEGMGEALGRALLSADRGTRRRSVLAAAYAAGAPATVHVAIGTDVVHQHPSFDGAAAGESSARDFRILAAQLFRIPGGTVLNLGSAVLLPEVFLKAFSVARNLGGSARGMTTATFDFMKQYRAMENVVRRPTLGVGRGYYLVGHHEILLPLLFHACLTGAGRASGSRRPARDKPLKGKTVTADRTRDKGDRRL